MISWNIVNVARIHRDLGRTISDQRQRFFRRRLREAIGGNCCFRIREHAAKLDSHKLAARRYALSSCWQLFQPQYRVDLARTHDKGVIDRTTAGLETLPEYFSNGPDLSPDADATMAGADCKQHQSDLALPSPFMSRTVLETMLQTRFSVRERSLLIRLMLAKYQPRLGAYPLEAGVPALPATWKTIPRFWPLVPYYAGKVTRKLRARRAAPAQPETSQNTQWHLWQSEEVQALLNPATMKATDILDRTAVAAFRETRRNRAFRNQLSGTVCFPGVGAIA